MAKISTRFRGKSWYYSFDAGTMPNGKRKRIEKGGFATEKEAKREGTIALASFLNGNISIVSEKVTVREFLADWLEHKSMDIRPRTLMLYRAIANRILPLIGDKYVQRIRPRDIDDTIRKLSRSGLARSTISVTLTVLKDFFSYAVYPAELIQANPAQYIKVPRNVSGGRSVERHVIRKEKMQELMDAYPFGHPCHVPIMVSYYTGMRLGEVLGLAWDCVDLKAGIVSVKRQASREYDGIKFTVPKTPTSIREIPIGGELVVILRRWRSQQAANEVEHGRAYFYTYEDENGAMWQMSKNAEPAKGMVRRALVCTRENGKAVSSDSVSCGLRLHGCNFHSLRHTHATICAENGAPAKGLAGRLGHSNTAITENLYTHETEAIKESTLQAFEKGMQKSSLQAKV